MSQRELQNRKVHKTEVVAILIKNNRLRALSASNSRKSKSSAIRLWWIASEGANEGTNERLHTLLIAQFAVRARAQRQQQVGRVRPPTILY